MKKIRDRFIIHRQSMLSSMVLADVFCCWEKYLNKYVACQNCEKYAENIKNTWKEKGQWIIWLFQYLIIKLNLKYINKKKCFTMQTRTLMTCV